VQPYGLTRLGKDFMFYLPGFTFLVPAYPGSPGQNPESRKIVVVVMVVVDTLLALEVLKSREKTGVD